MTALAVLRDGAGAGEGCWGQQDARCVLHSSFWRAYLTAKQKREGSARAVLLRLFLCSFMLVSRLFGLAFSEPGLFKILHNANNEA